MNKKKSFVLYCDQYETIYDLTLEEKGEILDAIYMHNREEDIIFNSRLAEGLFRGIRQQFVRDSEKWDSERDKRSSAGKKGGLAKASNARNARKNVANLADNVNVNVNVTDNVKSIVTPEKSKNKSQPLVESFKSEDKKKGVPQFDNDHIIWVKDNTPTLLKLKTPLTQDQAQWFADNYPEDVWQNVFKQMENWIPLKKKSSSSNLTAQNWLRRDGWFSFERMKEANYYEAKEILCSRAMAIYANKNPQAFNNK